MTIVQDVLTYLHELAPPQWAESYDNVGLYLGEAHTPISGILVSLDVTDAVLDEALAKGCNVILSHHPLWFSNRKQLTGDDWVSRLLLRAIRERVTLVACHTNLDNVMEGVNCKIAERIGLQRGRILQPKAVNSDRPVGAGLIGRLPQPMAAQAFLAMLAERFDAKGIRYTQTSKPVLEDHRFWDAGPELMLIDIGHYESEQFTSELLVDYLTRRFTTFVVLNSGTPTNPIQYFP
jgi:putative NIF3 family GTP cyclohydrolase 1 type 2